MRAISRKALLRWAGFAVLALALQAPSYADGKSEAVWFATVLKDHAGKCFCPPGSLTIGEALAIVKKDGERRGTDAVTEASVCEALSKVYPCGISLTRTVASMDDVRKGGSHSLNVEAPGNLAPSRALPCIDIDEVSGLDTPVDLFNAAALCAEKQDYHRSASLITVGTVFGRFDAMRVKDKTSHDAIQVLRMELANKLTKDQIAGIEASMNSNRRSATFVSEMCGRLSALGAPHYAPTYMIQHGMDAFRGGTVGGPLVQPFDAEKAWKEAFGGYLSCTAKPVGTATAALVTAVTSKDPADFEALDDLPVRFGDGVAAVQAAFHTTEEARPVPPVAPSPYVSDASREALNKMNAGKTMLKLEKEGLWFFFSGGKLDSVRMDAPYRGMLAGVHLGDRREAVAARLGAKAVDLKTAASALQAFYDVREGERTHFLFGARGEVTTMFRVHLPKAGEPGPPESLWKDGQPGELRHLPLTAVSSSVDKFTVASGALADTVSGDQQSLIVTASDACSLDCHGDLFQLGLPFATSLGSYLAKGHVQFDLWRSPSLKGKLVLWYGAGKGCNSYVLPAIKGGVFKHFSVPFKDFKQTCGEASSVRVPFHLVLIKGSYKPGRLVAVGDVKWTED